MRAFAEWLATTTGGRLDVLVNNAGIHLDLRSTWKSAQLLDGHEVHWRTNYLGTAHLTRLLLPMLAETARREGQARVVNVVSKLHERGRNEWLFDGVAPYDSWAAYGTSKLALVHEAAEIERRYGAAGVHGYSLHPGSVYTRIADRGLETAPVLGRLRKVFAPLERRALLTPEQGARTTVFCATSPDAVPGGYHRSGRAAEPSPDARTRPSPPACGTRRLRGCSSSRSRSPLVLGEHGRPPPPQELRPSPTISRTCRSPRARVGPLAVRCSE